MNKVLYSILLSFSLFYRVNAQSNMVVETEMGFLLGVNKYVPLWMTANKFGEVSQSAPAMMGHLRLYSDHVVTSDSLYKKRFFEFNYGLDAFGSLNAQSTANVSQAFVSARLGSFELSFGKRKKIFGFVDTLLTSGSTAWSGNALPVAMIELSTKGYLTIPFTNNLLAVSGTYAHGWLGEQRLGTFLYNNDINEDFKHYLTTYLHQKTMYVRLGKPKWKINYYGGFSHQAFWGNENIMIGGYDLTKSETYKRVIMGLNWNSSSIGNHLGSIDIAMNIKGKKRDIYLYRQFIYDTGSLLNGKNLDGLNGIRISNKIANNTSKIRIKSITIEYLYTNDQLDPSLAKLVNIPIAHNDYYNHYLYADGWTYKGRTLGTPLVTLERDLKYNDDKNIRGYQIANNRIYAIHFGLNGVYMKKSSFLFKGTFSHNLGNYPLPFDKPVNQFSGYLLLNRKIERFAGLSGSLALGGDIGGLYNNSLAMQISILKTWGKR